MSYLDHTVLWRSSSLSLEHGVDVGGHGHGDGLLGTHVPLPAVLMHFVVVQPLEGRVRVKENLVGVFLKEERERCTLVLRGRAVARTNDATLTCSTQQNSK